MEQIDNYEAACIALNLNAENEIPFKGDNLTERQRRANAHTKLMIINEAMHIGVEGRRIYFPVFWDTTDAQSSPGFSFNDYVRWSANTFVGARLQYATRAMAIEAGQKHLALYRELMARVI